MFVSLLSLETGHATGDIGYVFSFFLRLTKPNKVTLLLVNDDQIDYLMENNQRRPWTTLTMEELRARFTNRLFVDWGFGDFGTRGREVLQASGNLTHTAKHNAACFMPVFCEAVVSIRSSRPIRTEAWLSHTKIISVKKIKYAPLRYRLANEQTDYLMVPQKTSQKTGMKQPHGVSPFGLACLRIVVSIGVTSGAYNPPPPVSNQRISHYCEEVGGR
ncbi:unnamed protein product [Spodoptera exigua]|nr:unnamed protein product [Spodoptera exigua]